MVMLKITNTIRSHLIINQ